MLCELFMIYELTVQRKRSGNWVGKVLYCEEYLVRGSGKLVGLRKALGAECTSFQW